MEKEFLRSGRFLPTIWKTYSQFVENAMQPPSHARQHEADYIPNRLFTSGILFGIPAGFLALIPSAYLEWRSGDIDMVLFNIAALCTVAAIALNGYMSMQNKKAVAAAVVVLIGIVSIGRLGSFSTGSMCLLITTVFFALHFSDKLAFGLFGLNCVICLGFICISHFKLMDIYLLGQITTSRLIVNVVNFLLLNLLVIILIRQTIKRLERTIKREAQTYVELRRKMNEEQQLYNSLRESESQYKMLFFTSPSAKLIFDIDSLRFLQVNQAATHTYGFSEQEFLSKNLTDIHDIDKVDDLLQQKIVTDNHNRPPAIYTRHKRKDGKLIHVELLQGDIHFQGKPARMIVTNDITKQVEQVNAISGQNKKLREIAHTQSHEVRLPLTKIMALTDLIRDEFKGSGDAQLLDYLSISAVELDNVILKIVKDSSDILDQLDDSAVS